MGNINVLHFATFGILFTNHFFYCFYGKKEGFDYIFTTSDAAPNVIYAKDSYNLTEKLLKKLNEEYKITKEKK